MVEHDNPAEVLSNALIGGAPVVAVYFPDFGLRENIVEEVETTLPPTQPTRQVSSLKEALKSDPNHVVLFDPVDEAATLEELEAMREQLVGRNQPIVLFLLREGPGAKRLPDLPSLSSWIRGNEVDPEQLAEIDPIEARRMFELETGLGPEQWLDAHAGSLSSQPLGLYYRALFLRN
jgi:hypothetical protein